MAIHAGMLSLMAALLPVNAAQQANCTAVGCPYQSRSVSKNIAPVRHRREQNEPIAYTGTINMIRMMYLCVCKQQVPVSTGAFFQFYL